MTPEPDAITPAPRPRRSWFQRLGSVLFVIFCLELGLFRWDLSMDGELV